MWLHTAEDFDEDLMNWRSEIFCKKGKQSRKRCGGSASKTEGNLDAANIPHVYVNQIVPVYKSPNPFDIMAYLVSSSLGYTNIPARSEQSCFFRALQVLRGLEIHYCSARMELKDSRQAVLEAFVIGPGAAIFLYYVIQP